MKIILGLFLCLVFVLDSFGSPLIFEAYKTVSTQQTEILGEFNTSQYKQLRFKIAGYAQDNLDYTTFQISISAVENDVPISLKTIKGNEFSDVFDSPPAKIRVEVYGKGKWALQVWGTQ